MTYLKVAICTAALALFAFICVDAIGFSSDDGGATSHAVFVDTSGEETASIPDFDGDGTIGFGDFLILAGAFGSQQGDEEYVDTFDLNGDGEIGFSDFVIFAQNFGKEAPSPVVAIPDDNLRAAIEDALGKARGAPITVADMNSLDVLRAGSRGISDLTGLEYAASLTSLALGFNDIADVSALAGLTNLRTLRLTNNSITDVSALAGLTNLTFLRLSGNRELMDVSALSDLTKLTRLQLGFNFGIRDISALVGLTNLKSLDIRGNPLSHSSINDRIPALKSNGVAVLYDFWRAEGDFDIELVLLSSFTERQKEDLNYAVRRWMAVITTDLPDYTFAQNWSGRCGGQPYEISAGERIDDLRIYVRREEMEVGGWGGPRLLREETHLPVVGCMAFSTKETRLLPSLAIHEMGHVLGFGTIWEVLGFYQDPPDGDKHFNGPLAIAAFNDAGGWSYRGKRVPLENRAHWRLSELPDEVLITGSGRILSAITVQSLADLGYGVDVSQADAYALPGATSGAKIAVSPSAGPGIDGIIFHPDIIRRTRADPGGQGSIEGRLPPGPTDGRTDHLESGGLMRGGGIAFDLPDERQIWGMGSPGFTEPKLTCGAGLMDEPIYVVDPQGRIVRTINR